MNRISEYDTTRQALASLFEERFGCLPASIVRMPQGGGDRVYYRLGAPEGCSPASAVGVYGPDLRENEAFVGLTRVFFEAGIPVPRLYATGDGGHCYLLEDLGDTQLLSLILKGEGMELCRSSLADLAAMQSVDRSRWEGLCMARPFSRRQVMWDLNYFKYEYLKPSAVAFDEEALEDDFERLADTLTDVPESTVGFMFRDFQSRNVMVDRGYPRFIDYQGGRPGPVVYDAVSFLWQAKAGFTAAVRRELIELYATEFACRRGIDASEITGQVPRFALFRTLQVLGAYGFRGLVEHRAHFLESIPGALANLAELLDSGALDGCPELKRVCRVLAADPRFAPVGHDGLTVTVFSFSYKKGYPADYSGNGGGFMFDCRAMHNPGRYAEYRNLTGRDEAVIAFLEERGEVQPFLASAHELTDKAVRRYLDRGFSSLQIGFGCTGGQHRSVYCAEATARHIAALFPEAHVRLVHREQNIEETIQ